MNIKRVIRSRIRNWELHLSKTSKKRYINYLRKQGVKIGENIWMTPCIKTVNIDITRPSLVEIGDYVRIDPESGFPSSFFPKDETSCRSFPAVKFHFYRVRMFSPDIFSHNLMSSISAFLRVDKAGLFGKIHCHCVIVQHFPL